MIRINNIEYNKFETEISWKNFLVSSYGHKRTGIAPFITFCINNMFIGLELTFSKEMFENTVLWIKTDIKEYISDVTFEDEKGWLSINDGQYECNIIRINEKNFHIIFHIIAYDLDDEFDIFIDDEIEILEKCLDF